MGSKVQRQNQHVKRIERKIRQYKAKSLSTENLEKELGFASGNADRPEFRTGREADPRIKKKIG
jgi:hypothetical protein